MEELQCKTVFTIPVFGGIPVAESVAVTWVIMAVLLILSLVLVRNLSVENPGKKQLLLETGVSFLHNFFKDILGEEGKMYIPYLMTVVIYIGIANIFGVFGFVPPTKDLNCTIGLAITSIFLSSNASSDCHTTRSCPGHRLPALLFPHLSGYLNSPPRKSQYSPAPHCASLQYHIFLRFS